MSSQLSQHTSIFHCKLNSVNSCLIQDHLQTFTSTLESKKWRFDIESKCNIYNISKTRNHSTVITASVSTVVTANNPFWQSSHTRMGVGRTFAVASPTAWNSRSDDLRDPTLSTDSFRHLLKTRVVFRVLVHVAH